MRKRGNTAHALHAIEHKPFCLQNGMHRSGDLKSRLAFHHCFAVLLKKGERCLRLQVMNDILRKADACYDAILFYPEYGLAFCTFRNGRKRGVIAAANVFGKGGSDEFGSGHEWM